ncbi:MAG: diaminopimelate epimerase [Candidatus Omnitrophica bacterium]|nr:diaminopimelate epimerase [Candidatus Omnitrophota bacterium]
MNRLTFVKMVATGNDFVLIDSRNSKNHRSYPNIARLMCERKIGIGADGLLVLEKSSKADLKMRIFNADGSEAEMCGNGLRCVVLYASNSKRGMDVETMAGIYHVHVTGEDRVKIKMEEPKNIKTNIPIKVNGRAIKVDYVDTGVPHTVIFVQGLDKIDIGSIGRNVRYHKRFKPRGTNVDFVEVIDDGNIKMRTYERGMEAETLACGTGAVASALITSCILGLSTSKLNVHTKGGILKVHFDNKEGRFKNVYLEGDVRKVFKGEVDYV